MSQRRVCRWVGVHRTPIRYAKRRPPDTERRGRLRELAAAHPRWVMPLRGGPRRFWLLRREGRPDTDKRVACGRSPRRYRAEGLAVAPRPVPSGPNVRWHSPLASMDFGRDTTARGRVFRVLTLVDEFTRQGRACECLAIEVEPSLPAVRVAGA